MVTGIRHGELRNMLFDDVDVDRRIVTVRASTAKNHKAREIPLDDEMLDIIAKLREAAPHRQPGRGNTPEVTARIRANFSRDHVFVTTAGTPWRNNLLTRFYTICKRIGIDGAEPGGSVDIHSLRVTFTTMAIGGGGDPKAVQEILGHSSLALTMGIYAKATDRSKRAAIGALPFAKSSAPDHVIPMQSAHAVSTSKKSSSQPVAYQRVAAVS